MDKQELVTALNTNTLNEQFGILHDGDAQDALMHERLAELAGRDAAVRDSVTTMLELTGYKKEVGTLYSPSIRVGRIEHPVLGAGVLTAKVRQGLNHPCIDTFFGFTRPGRKEATIAGEHYAVSFSDNFVAYARREARGSLEYGGPQDVLMEKIRKDLPQIEAAELTLAMLWEALRDPELNPQFAEAAQTLQQG